MYDKCVYEFIYGITFKEKKEKEKKERLFSNIKKCKKGKSRRICDSC